jgi:hypothetical protein
MCGRPAGLREPAFHQVAGIDQQIGYLLYGAGPPAWGLLERPGDQGCMLRLAHEVLLMGVSEVRAQAWMRHGISPLSSRRYSGLTK